jgi:hypothetical protein
MFSKKGGHGRPFTIRLGDGLERKGQMTPKKDIAAEGVVVRGRGFAPRVMKQALEQVLEAEMSEAPGSGKSERSEGR